MKIKSIYVNLPVKDLERSRTFWTKIGFSFNEDFSDDKALCLELHDGLMYSMLISHEFLPLLPTGRLQTDRQPRY